MTTLTERRGTLAWFVEPALIRPALLDSVRRLTPRYQWRNPVMFVVYIGSILTTLLWVQALVGQGARLWQTPRSQGSAAGGQLDTLGAR